MELPFHELGHLGQVRRLRALAATALTQYDIPYSRLSVLQHGDNTTFRVDSDSGRRYVLRVHRPSRKTAAEIRSEMLWLTALQQDATIVVPDPVPTRDGKVVVQAIAEGLPEARLCVLLGWVNGRFMDKGLTPSHLERVGTFMAHLQERAARFQPPDTFVRGRLDNLYGKPPGISEAAAHQQVENPADEAAALQAVAEVCSAEDAALVERVIRKVRAVQRAVGHHADSFGLIHGDLHQENYLFHKGQVRAIDFDDCGYGHYLYDVAVTLYNVNWRDNAAPLRAGFLAGYRRARELSGAHEQYVDTFMQLRDLQMMIWSIEMRDHPAFRNRWADEVKTILKDFRESDSG